MEQRRINEKTSAFANMSRRDAGAPRAEPLDTVKTHRYICCQKLQKYAIRRDAGVSRTQRYRFCKNKLCDFLDSHIQILLNAHGGFHSALRA
jgi:hypothetical protein